MSTSIKGTIKKRGDNSGSCLDFTADKTTISYNEDVTFTPTGRFLKKGEPTFLWDFGDDTTSTDREPIHHYDNAQSILSSFVTIKRASMLMQVNAPFRRLLTITSNDGEGALEYHAPENYNTYVVSQDGWRGLAFVPGNTGSHQYFRQWLTIDTNTSSSLFYGTFNLHLDTYGFIMTPTSAYSPTGYVKITDSDNDITITDIPYISVYGYSPYNLTYPFTLPINGAKKIEIYSEQQCITPYYYVHSMGTDYRVTFDFSNIRVTPMDVSLKVTKDTAFRQIIKKGYINIIT